MPLTFDFNDAQNRLNGLVIRFRQALNGSSQEYDFLDLRQEQETLLLAEKTELCNISVLSGEAKYEAALRLVDITAKQVENALCRFEHYESAPPISHEHKNLLYSEARQTLEEGTQALVRSYKNLEQAKAYGCKAQVPEIS